MKVEMSYGEAWVVNRWCQDKIQWILAEPFGFGETEKGKQEIDLYAAIAVKMARVMAVGLSKTNKQGRATDDAG